MGLIRDKVDLSAVSRDMQRAAQAGGPRQIAKDPGHPRGSDRFPSAKSRRRRSSKR